MRRSHPSRAFWFTALALLAVGCGDSDESEGSDPDGDAITTECGTFDPDEPNAHGIVPNDPASPNIVLACQDLCDKMAGVEGCSVDATTCVDDCRLRACDVCPGKLEPLTRCRSESFDASGCTCEAMELVCQTPPDCEDEESALGHCGG